VDVDAGEFVTLIHAMMEARPAQAGWAQRVTSFNLLPHLSVWSQDEAMGMKARKSSGLLGSMTGAIHHQSGRSGHTLHSFQNVAVVVLPNVATGAALACCGYNNQRYSMSLNLKRLAGNITGNLQILSWKFPARLFETTWTANQVIITFPNNVRSTNNGLLIRANSLLAITG
jgi:hypothetical protein